MKLSWIVYLSFVFSSISTVAATAVDLERFSSSKEWQALLHYKPNMLGAMRSTIDGGDFFLSSDGATNAHAEMVSSIEAIQSNRIVGKLKQTVFCAFPERTRYLVEIVGVELSDEIKKQKCEKYENFFAQFNTPKKISLVYSSSYPNNPASMFGHTFLKVHSERNTDLLDIGINYAAQVADDENPFAFFWFGVTGGYDGQWSAQPYYVKVHEYVSFESRDLWEYEINLTEQEIKRLINHIWELEVNANIDYYFFDENCSYQVLAAIEAIKPEWDLLNYTIYVIPGESIKYLSDVPHAIRTVKFRPSSFKKSIQKIESLNSNEREIYFKSLAEKKVDAKNSNALVLEALLSDLEFKRNDDIDVFKKEWLAFESETRSARARLGLLPADQQVRLKPIDDTSRPDLSHNAYSLILGAGYNDQRSEFLKVKIKSAYHDFLNSDVGYAQFAHIDFPWIDFRYYEEEKKFSLYELGGLETTSVLPRNHLKNPMSYKAKIAYRQNDLGSDHFHYLLGEGGVGSTFKINTFDQRLYVFAIAVSQFAKNFEQGYRIGPGIETGFLTDLKNGYKLQIGAKVFCDASDEDGCYGETQYQFNQALTLGTNHELRNNNTYQMLHHSNDLTEFSTTLDYVYFFR